MSPASAGKDSTTGHWEIAGVHLAKAFPDVSGRLSRERDQRIRARTGREVIGNVVGSGTDVIARFGEEHVRTGALDRVHVGGLGICRSPRTRK